MDVIKLITFEINTSKNSPYISQQDISLYDLSLLEDPITFGFKNVHSYIAVGVYPQFVQVRHPMHQVLYVRGQDEARDSFTLFQSFINYLETFISTRESLYYLSNMTSYGIGVNFNKPVINYLHKNVSKIWAKNGTAY